MTKYKLTICGESFGNYLEALLIALQGIEGLDAWKQVTNSELSHPGIATDLADAIHYFQSVEAKYSEFLAQSQFAEDTSLANSLYTPNFGGVNNN